MGNVWLFNICAWTITSGTGEKYTTISATKQVRYLLSFVEHIILKVRHLVKVEVIKYFFKGFPFF